LGVFTRPDSPWWWLYLETTKRKERTKIKIGQTTAQRHDSRRLANELYHQRMNELAARLYKLPTAQPAIRFEKYAATYAADVIEHHRGKRRELELLVPLVRYFRDDILSTIDRDRVRAYMTARKQKVSARTVNREIDLLKAMLRDAVPKYLTTSPVVGLKRLPIVTPKRRLLKPAEERKLLKVGDEQDRAIIILGIDTLMRLGDLLDLELTDRDGAWLRVKDPKSGEPYEVALSPRAAKALDAIDTERYYFTKFRKAENPRDWAGSVRQRLEYLCREAGNLPYGRAIGGITFHWSTRRTGATRLLVKKRIPVPIVQRQGNWKTPDVLLNIYAEADRGDLLKAVGHSAKSARKHG